MSPPIENAISAPLLFALYLLALGAVIAVCHRVLQRADPSSAVPPPVPEAPDPYQIAYLRGGRNELTRLVIFSLLRKGYLCIAPETKPGEPTYERRIVHSGEEPGPLTDVERQVWEWFQNPRRASEIFASNLPWRVERACASLRQELEQQQLLMPAQFGAIAGNVRFCGIIALLALWTPTMLSLMSWEERSRMSSYPMGPAHDGLDLVAPACISAFISLVLLLGMGRSGRLSRRGLAYLQRLQLAFASLQRRGRRDNSDLLLLVALFGLGALTEAEHALLPQIFRYGAGGDNTEIACGSCNSDCGS